MAFTQTERRKAAGLVANKQIPQQDGCWRTNGQQCDSYRGRGVKHDSFPVDGVFVADHVAYGSDAGDGQNYNDGEHVTSCLIVLPRALTAAQVGRGVSETSDSKVRQKGGQTFHTFGERITTLK
jgi:hypothetical protein